MKLCSLFALLFVGIMMSAANADIMHYSIPANAFFPVELFGNDEPFSPDDKYYLYPWDMHPLHRYPHSLACSAVNLPDGAIVTDFRAWVYDVSSNENIWVVFARQYLWTMDTLQADFLAACSSNGTGGLQEIVSDSLWFVTIDNSIYKYFVMTGLEDSVNTRMVGVRIQYDLASAVEERQSVPGINPGVLRSYPNPSRNFVTIVYSTSAVGNAEIYIYNEAGQKVRTLINAEQAAGEHVLIWDGRDDRGALVPSGSYFYLVKVGTSTSSRKMVMIR